MQDNKFSNNFYNTIGVDFVRAVIDTETEEHDSWREEDQATDRTARWYCSGIPLDRIASEP